jgi:hypothetical protein
VAASAEQAVEIATPAQVEIVEGITLRAVLWSLLFLVISCLWLQHAGLIAHGTQIGEAVPVIPAVGAVIFLTLIAPLLRPLPRYFRLSQQQIMLVYIFLCVAITMPEVGVVRMLFPNITALFYFASPENDFARFQQYLPPWMVPHDLEVIRQMYEGSPTESVPLRPWLLPLSMWGLFYLSGFLAMLGVISMFRRQWADKERLTFPIVQMILHLSGHEGRGGSSFFRNPLMWTGFAAAAIYNVLNILNAWNPAVPAMGRGYDLGRLFTERPWSAIQPLTIAWRPENFGLGYLVSTEITFSVWFFYLLLRISNVVAVMMGYEIPGFPFDQEQAAGAYLAMSFFLIYVARHHLAAVWRAAFSAGPADDADEPLPYRWSVLAAVAGMAGMWLFAVRAGMWWWTAAIYLSLFILFALVYARARAEAGAAMVWLFPFYQHKRMMLNVLGSRAFVAGDNWANLTIFSVLMLLSRGFYQSMMAYQLESEKIASETNIKRRHLGPWLVAAMILGLLGAYWVHLTAYYTHGCNVLEGGTTEGGYRTALARGEFEELASFLKAPKPPDIPRSLAGAWGFVLTVGLVAIRSYFLRFPLHPLGFAMVASYGYPLWGPFLLVWIIKTIVLRIGGMRLYRQLVPFFLGVVIGHYFVAGLVWGWLSIFNEMYRRYCVHFG